MKKYKFLSNDNVRVMTKKLNKYVNQGWKLIEWKINDNVIVVLLEKGDTQ